MINYYYCASDIALETDIHGIQTVKRASQPVTLTPVRTHIIDFLLKYPKASFDEIVAALAMMTGKPPVMASVASDLEELGRMHLVACQTLPPRLNMPYPIDHTCECCGCSCLAQLVGPLTDNEHANILDAHQDLAASGAVHADVNPIMKGLKPDGTCLHFLNFPGKRCFFLGDDNLCKIHGKFGAMKKPAACRRFPLIAIRTESEIRIGIKPYCYANMRVCKLEPAASDALAWYEAAQSTPNTADLDAQHCEMKIMLDDLIENAAFREHVLEHFVRHPFGGGAKPLCKKLRFSAGFKAPSPLQACSLRSCKVPPQNSRHSLNPLSKTSSVLSKHLLECSKPKPINLAPPHMPNMHTICAHCLKNR